MHLYSDLTKHVSKYFMKKKGISYYHLLLNYVPRRPDWLWGPPNLLSKGYRGALSPGLKRPVRETGHSPPANAEVKKVWIYTSTLPYAFMT
jgi:hypothetical protein